jgi:hypothetical protein
VLEPSQKSGVVDEARDIQPTEGPLAAEPSKRRWPLVVGVLVGTIVVLGLAAVFGTRALYSRTFDSLVETTRSAEGAQVWRDFFVAQDCFIDAAVEAGDAELAFNEGLSLLDETDLLARHVSLSLAAFADVSVLPWHGRLAAARDAIVAHYEVWDRHLVESATALEGLDSDPVVLAAQFQSWVELVVRDGEAIGTTFEDSESAFQLAALDDSSRQEIDALFTASDVECTRGAV